MPKDQKCERESYLARFFFILILFFFVDGGERVFFFFKVTKYERFWFVSQNLSFPFFSFSLIGEVFFPLF